MASENDNLPPPPPTYNPYSSSDPSMRVPVNTYGTSAALSPYLNIDPSYLGIGQPDSQFIFPEGASRTRGRLELSFSQIGAACVLGGSIGGLNGAYKGLQDAQLKQLVGANRRTQVINVVAKGGASSAQTLGVISLIYSICGVILSKTRGVDDEVNTLIAGTTTGLLFNSSSLSSKQWGKFAKGGGIGFGLSLAYVLFTNQDKIKDYFR